VLIHHCSRLSAAVALKAIENLRSDGVVAENAFKNGSTTQRFCCVIAHIVDSSLFGTEVFRAIDADLSIGKQATAEQLVWLIIRIVSLLAAFG
jgi:hypothetical protein